MESNMSTLIEIENDIDLWLDTSKKSWHSYSDKILLYITSIDLCNLADDKLQFENNESYANMKINTKLDEVKSIRDKFKQDIGAVGMLPRDDMFKVYLQYIKSGK